MSAQTGWHEVQAKSSYTPDQPNPIYLPFLSYSELEPGFFVSPVGSDTNPGTMDAPWKTIRKAASMVRPGSLVYIRGGIYNESVSFRTSGTAQAPIRIVNYPNETPVIDGQNSIPGVGGSLLSINGDYIQVTGIEVRNSAYMGIYVYGSYDLVDQVYVHHSKENGIFITHGSHSIVQNSRVWRNAISNEYRAGSGWASGLSVARYSVSYVTIRNNTVWENWGEGISSFNANQVTIEGNLAHDNLTGNIYISDSTNVVCQRNFIYMDPNSYVYQQGPNHGIMLGDETYNPPSSNISVINNIVVGTNHNFYWWQGVQGGGMLNVLIANNTFVNSFGSANVNIGAGSHSNVSFENNIVEQDSATALVITSSRNTGVSYSKNLWSKQPSTLVSGPGDIIASPGFAQTGDPFSPDWYRITRLSPAVNIAQPISQIVSDYFGSLRGNLPDIGAVEYVP